MSDRELLEKAARAAGWKYHPPGSIDTKHPDLDGWIDPSTGEVHWRDLWRPLTDDGDALRLACDLNIQMTPGADGDPYAAVQWWTGPSLIEQDFDRVLVEGGDRLAALRRAIVRAAAAIGESMP